MRRRIILCPVCGGTTDRRKTTPADRRCERCKQYDRQADPLGGDDAGA